MIAGRRRALLERLPRRLLDGDAVHHRIRERDADLHRVGAGVGERVDHLDPVAAEASGDVRNQQLVPGLAPGPQMRLQRTGHNRSPVRRSAIWAASLSPRPESVTSTVEPDGHRPPGLAGEPADRVRGLERGNDPLGDRQELEAGDGLVVGGVHVLGPARGRELRVLGADARVVEPGADRVRLEDLAVFVLQEQRTGPVQHAGHAPAHRRAVLTRLQPVAARLHADQPRRRVEETGERADRVRASADARDDEVGIGAEDGAALRVRLVADDALELPHHPRVRVRAHDGPDAVVRGLDGRDPVAQRFVDRVLERRAAARDGNDVGTEALHAEHVERLPFDVDRAHEHEAVEPEQRRRGGGGHAVLAGTGLGDDALLAHPPREQRLAEHVVDLVRPGVREVFALQQHAHAEAFREPVTLGDRSGTARVRREELGELGAERVVAPRLAEVAFEVDERGHQRLGNEPTAELAEATEIDRFGAGGPERDGEAARRDGLQSPSSIQS